MPPFRALHCRATTSHCWATRVLSLVAHWATTFQSNLVSPVLSYRYIEAKFFVYILVDRPTELPVQLKSILKKPTYGIHQMTGNASFASPVLPHATEVTGLDYTGTPVHFHEMTKSQTPLIPSAYKKKEVKISKCINLTS